jgi:hypothetical protein
MVKTLSEEQGSCGFVMICDCMRYIVVLSAWLFVVEMESL